MVSLCPTCPHSAGAGGMSSGPERTFIMLLILPPLCVCVCKVDGLQSTVCVSYVKAGIFISLPSLSLPFHHSSSTSISVCFTPHHRLRLGPFCVCLSFCYLVSFVLLLDKLNTHVYPLSPAPPSFFALSLSPALWCERWWMTVL